MMLVTLFLLSFVISLLLTPLVRKLAFRLGAIDYPNRRRINQSSIPSLGGLAIYISFVLSLLILGANHRFVAVVLSSSIIVIIGIIDDLYELSATAKLSGQILAALSLILLGVRIELITNPWGGIYYLGLLSFPVTLVWLVGVTNTINLVDGLDGLATGVSIIAAVTLGVIAYQQGQLFVLGLIAPLVGSSLGFLPYNLNPAQIFMGDTGSMFLGFSLGSIAIISSLKTITVVTILISLLALGVPMFDTIFAILRRKSAGNPLFKADKGHLHHRLMNLGCNQLQVMFIIYLLSTFLGIIAVGINKASINQIVCLISATTLFLAIGFWELKSLNENITS